MESYQARVKRLCANIWRDVRIVDTQWYTNPDNGEYLLPRHQHCLRNLAPNCNIDQHFNGQVGGTYFNAACVCNPDYGAFGNAPGYLSNLRYPGLATEDIGFNKTVVFNDRYRLSLRFQMFNAFNRHRFSGPNTTIGDPRFGTVPADNLNGQNPRIGQFGARFTF